MRELTAAPGADGASIVERLVEDLSSLGEQLWLVIDDVHGLRSDEAVRDLERLLASASARLRFARLSPVLACLCLLFGDEATRSVNRLTSYRRPPATTMLCAVTWLDAQARNLPCLRSPGLSRTAQTGSRAWVGSWP